MKMNELHHMYDIYIEKVIMQPKVISAIMARQLENIYASILRKHESGESILSPIAKAKAETHLMLYKHIKEENNEQQ